MDLPELKIATHGAAAHFRFEVFADIIADLPDVERETIHHKIKHERNKRADENGCISFGILKEEAQECSKEHDLREPNLDSKLLRLYNFGPKHAEVLRYARWWLISLGHGIVYCRRNRFV